MEVVYSTPTWRPSFSICQQPDYPKIQIDFGRRSHWHAHRSVFGWRTSHPSDHKFCVVASVSTSLSVWINQLNNSLLLLLCPWPDLRICCSLKKTESRVGKIKKEPTYSTCKWHNISLSSGTWQTEEEQLSRARMRLVLLLMSFCLSGAGKTPSWLQQMNENSLEHSLHLGLLLCKPKDTVKEENSCSRTRQDLFQGQWWAKGYHKKRQSEL